MRPEPTRPPLEALLAHRAWVRSLARSLAANSVDADDLEQDVWLAAVKARPRGGAGIRAWFARVAHNRAAERTRLALHRNRRETLVVRSGESRDAPALAADADAHSRVLLAVLELDEPYLETVLLRFYEGLPPRDVAARMRVPVATVRTRLRRAAGALREMLGGRREDWLGVLGPLLAGRPDRGALEVAQGVAMKASTKILIAASVVATVSAVPLIYAVLRPSVPGRNSDAVDPEVAAVDRSATPRTRVRTRAPRTRSNDARDAPPTLPSTDPPDAPTLPRSRPTGTSGPSTREELLEFLASRAGPPTPHMDLLRDADSFARFFVESTGHDAQAPRPTAAEGLLEPDRATIAFPTGCHRWDPAARELADDVVVTGAGMDNTLVVLDRPISLVGRRSVTLRNLTVHCNDNALVAVNGEAALIHLENVRVIGFDCGGTAGDMIRGRAVAVWVERSRIESGFGSAPGEGYIFNTSPGTRAHMSVSIARFDKCVVRGPLHGFRHAEPSGAGWLPIRPGQTCLLSRCELIAMDPAQREGIERPSDFLRLDECTVTYAAEPTGDTTIRRDVAELNPSWRIPPRRETR